MAELAYVNGTWSPIGEARVSIEDRGFQFGDGVYEVIAAYGGRAFLMDRHMARLRRSAEAIGLEVDFERAGLEALVAEGVRRSDLGDTMVYLQMTRGAAARSHVIQRGLTPTVVLTFRPLPKVAEDVRRRGVKAITIRDDRWDRCFIKAITLLPNVLAKNEAMRRGYDEAIYVADNGEVRECPSANVFIVKEGALRLPPRNESILHGVTQGVILECAEMIGTACMEGRCDVELLRSADEVFLSNTTSEVLGITSIDDRPVGDGLVGPITKRLHEAFASRARGGVAK